MTHFDIALIGFGAATMSLAVRLASDYPGRVAVIEPRELPSDDRTWCGWRLADHPFTDQAAQTWSAWAVSHGGRELVCRSDHIPYEMLRASAVQARALDAVASRPDWQFFSRQTLQTATYEKAHWRLSLSSGATITADCVMDSRPPGIGLDRPWLWQSFVGRELIGPDLPATGPVRLMDFIDDDAPLLTFVYELPISDGRRLIELTRFAPQRPSLAELGTSLDRLLDARGLATHTIDREESSHLPMAPIPPTSRSGWMRVGTAGGSMRPATGYAFHGIQRWADACARSLIAGNNACPPSRSRWMDWLDGVFLESLWADGNADAPGARFHRLFECTPPESMARFLMSRPRLGDIGHVLGALPMLPMLGAAGRHSIRRRRTVTLDQP